MTWLKEECYRMAWGSLCFWALCVPTVQLQAAGQGDSPDALRLWYTQPATEWTDALPIGNGRLGAMVYGGVDQEHLQLNEDTLWSGGPHCYDNPDAYQHLATVRQLLERGEYADAEATAQKMLGRHKYQLAYMPFGDLFLDFPKGDKPSEYRRALNLQDAVSTVTYRIGNVADRWRVALPTSLGTLSLYGRHRTPQRILSNPQGRS
jgi:alpha-L-fucosidase 2